MLQAQLIWQRGGKSYVRAARSSRPSDRVAIRRAVVKQMKFEREFMSTI